MIRQKIVLFILVACCLSLFLPGQAFAKWQAKAIAGELAPEFTLPVMDGKKIRLKDYCGASAKTPQVVILLFMAEWCKVCHEKALPDLTKWQQEAGGKLQVLVISVDNDPKLDHYRQLKLPYPVLLDKFNVLAPRYGFDNVLPMTALISPNGRVVNVWEGYSEEVAQQIKTALDKSLVDFSQ